MLANRAQPQTQAGAEEHDVDGDQQDNGDVDDHVLLEEDRADERDGIEDGNFDIRNQESWGVPSRLSWTP